MEGIDTIPNTDADNALILGTALHTGIEEGVISIHAPRVGGDLAG